MKTLQELPQGCFKVECWEDGKTVTWVNTIDNVFEGCVSVTQSCGCCSENESASWEWDELEDEIQRQIIEEFEQGTAKPC